MITYRERNAYRDHKNDADDVSLVSRFSVIQKVSIDVENSQRSSSSSAYKSDYIVVNGNNFPHFEITKRPNLYNNQLEDSQ